ncbi:MAG TPA: thioredoxin-dependent thiol peroxidase [Spirochaetes bacterium]|nr:thioredoxin-dependent thiol peroxidase [Spirochaetota bacterium]
MSKEGKKPEAGKAAPPFCLPDKDRNEVCLKDFTGRWVVLYFYPRDNTSGCTLEAVDFTANLDEFKKLKAVVLGVSTDSPESHCRFSDRHGLKVTLLSDEEHRVMEQYGVWGVKKMYGRESMGVVRSTFLIDPKGVLRHRWDRVKVKGHVESVREKLLELKKQG